MEKRDKENIVISSLLVFTCYQCDRPTATLTAQISGQIAGLLQSCVKFLNIRGARINFIYLSI